jgi:hypothetical protein
MTSPQDHENELRRREKNLEERELKIRLRELESELYQDVPLHKTVKHQPEPSKFQRWKKKATKILMFTGVVITALVVLNVVNRIASLFFGALILGGIAFVAYKIFFEERAKS